MYCFLKNTGQSTDTIKFFLELPRAQVANQSVLQHPIGITRKKISVDL